MVRAMRARSCSMVVSLSSKRGGSTPARRDTEFFARSQAIWIWRVSGSMSGARREPSSTLASNLRCVALFAAFSSSQDRLPRVFANMSTEKACIDAFMNLSSLGERAEPLRPQDGAQILDPGGSGVPASQVKQYNLPIRELRPP